VTSFGSATVRGAHPRNPLRKAALIPTLFVLLAALSGPAAAGIAPSAVKTGTANEQRPAATTAWFAWTQAPPDHPNRTNVWAEATPVDGTDEFRVNPPGTRAWTGGIEGNQLVYQQIDGGDSDIRRANLTSIPPPISSPPNVNTDRWEWAPTISTDSNGDAWILFGRQNTSSGAQRVIAYNVDTAASRELQMTTNFRYALIPGQVNGDWATWTSCKPNCQVRYVNLVDASPIATVPRPSFVRHQYAPSVAEDGTLYYVRSGSGCGANVRLMRTDAGSTQRLVDLPDRRDIFTTYASDEGLQTRVYYDRVGCGSGAWNIYALTN
jgi:hypothetical protein